MRRFVQRARPGERAFESASPRRQAPASATGTRSCRSRKRRRARARRQPAEVRLSQEQLEARIALAVAVGGYTNTVDAFQNNAPIAGRAIIASDNASDVYVRQVASVTQDLQVSTSGNFLGYQVIDDIDGLYQQIFITNGTRRIEQTSLTADYSVVNARTSTFLLDHELVAFEGVDILPGITGTLEYRQYDGTLSTWSFGPGVVSQDFDGPGYGGVPLPPGYVRPTGIAGVSVDDGRDTTIAQSVVVITWSNPVGPAAAPRLVQASYLTDDIGGIGITANVSAAQGATSGNVQTVRVTLPEALDAMQDGVSLWQSLGVIPGSLRGSGISFRWGSSGSFRLPAFQVDARGIMRFGGDSSTYVFAPTGGVIDVRGRLVDGAVLELEFRRWVAREVDDDNASFFYQGSVNLEGGASDLRLDGVEYLTYTRDTAANTVSIVPGQTISRGLTVDLLTPGSTLSVQSPVVVAADWIESTGVSPEEDIDLRATNIVVEAGMASPDRLSIGRSQVARERLSLPPDYENPYLFTPSVPGIYSAFGTGLPSARTALAVVNVNAAGEVVSLESLPGFEGYGYHPDNPPQVSIDPPPATGGVRAEARAIVAPDGRVAGYVITEPGSGYDRLPVGTRPGVTVATALPQASARARVAEIDAATGQVTKIDVLDAGYRYHAPPRVVVAPPETDADGVQATARAVLGPEGRIERIEVVSPGRGYQVRPVVTVAEPSPAAMAEQVIFEAAVEADVYELYVGDDPGTDRPRGSLLLNNNGSFAAAPVSVQIQTVTPGANPTRDPITLTLAAADGSPLQEGLSFSGAVISGFGIVEGTRVRSWDPQSSAVTVAAGSVNSAVTTPISATIASGADSLYLEATQADVLLEGLVNVGRQSYLLNSAESVDYLSPFVLTTRSPVTGTQTGTIEGDVVDIILGNEAEPPVVGSTAFSEIDLRTRVDSLRVQAAESVVSPQGPFPYNLSIDELDSISIDGVAASSGPISINAANDIEITSVIDTAGDVFISARGDTGPNTQLRVTAPLRTSFGRIELDAGSIEMRNSIAVTAAAVEPGRRDISIDARAGSIVLQGEVYAINDIFMEQVNREDSFEQVQITRTLTVATGDSTQQAVLARPDGGQLPAGFDPVGVRLVSDTITTPARIVGWNPVTSTAEVAIDGGTPPIADVPAGGPAVIVQLSRPVTSSVSGVIDGELARVIGNELTALAEGAINLRTDLNQMTATAGAEFTLSERNDIGIPLLAAGGLVSLEALGVDLGPTAANPVALTATLLDVTNLAVNTPNGSARIEVNSDDELVVGDAARIFTDGDRAPQMLAAGDVVIRSRSGAITLLDAPIGGQGSYPVRVATPAPLPATTTYLPGNPGLTPSSLSGVGSLNRLTQQGGASYWEVQELAVGDLVLVKDQQHARENGIYRVAALGGGAYGSQRWRLVRASDADTASDMPNGLRVRVSEGGSANKFFRITYDSIVPTVVERVGTNQLQFPELFPNFDLLEPGMIVNGEGIAADSYISTIDKEARVVTLDVVRPGQVFPLGLTDTGEIPVTGVLGDTLELALAQASWAKLEVGQEVTGAGITPGSVIVRIDEVASKIELAETFFGTAAVNLQGQKLVFNPVETDPVFSLFRELSVGQKVQLYDAEATPLGVRTITKIVSDVSEDERAVEIDNGVSGTAATARIWAPGAVPSRIGPHDLASVGIGSVVVAKHPDLANVRVGQLFQLKDASGFIIGNPRAVTGIVLRRGNPVLNEPVVVDDVTISFNTLLTSQEAAFLGGGTIEFLPPATISVGVAEPGAVPVEWNSWSTDHVVEGGVARSQGDIPIALPPGGQIASPLRSITPVQTLVPTAAVIRGAGTASIGIPGTSSLWFESARLGQVVQFLSEAGNLIGPRTEAIADGLGTSVVLLPEETTWFGGLQNNQTVQFLDAEDAVVGTARVAAFVEDAQIVELTATVPETAVSIRRLNAATITGLNLLEGTINLSEPTPGGVGQVRLLTNAVPLLGGVGGQGAGIQPFSPFFEVSDVDQEVEFLNAAGTAVLGVATIISLDPVFGQAQLSEVIPAGTGLIRNRHVVSISPAADFLATVRAGDVVEFLDVFGSLLDPPVADADVSIVSIDRDAGYLTLSVPAPDGTAQLRLPNVAIVPLDGPFVEAAIPGREVVFFDRSGNPIEGEEVRLKIESVDPATGEVRFVEGRPVPAFAVEVAVVVPLNATILDLGSTFFTVAAVDGEYDEVRFRNADGQFFKQDGELVDDASTAGTWRIKAIDLDRGVVEYYDDVPEDAAFIQIVGREAFATIFGPGEFFDAIAVGDLVEFISRENGEPEPVGGGEYRIQTIGPVTLGSATIWFSGVPDEIPAEIRVYSRVVRMPNFDGFSDLSVGLEVSGDNIPAGTTIAAINVAAHTITLTQPPEGPLSTVRFGITSNARYPSADTLVLTPEFTNWERIFVGQRVYGAGVKPGAEIVAVDRIARTVALSAGSVASQQEARVVRADSRVNRFYPGQFEDWIELDRDFNEFFELGVGQKVELQDELGNLLKVAKITGIDPEYRAIGLENGSLNGIQQRLAQAKFLAPSSVRFGVLEGVGSVIPDLLLEPVGLASIKVEEVSVQTNIGSDLTGRVVTFVVSTNGRTNDTTGSLGKMINLTQLNDTTTTQLDVAVREVRETAAGWVLVLDELFAAYDRLQDVSGLWLEKPVYGTPRMFTADARVVDSNAQNRTVTLNAQSLSALATEDLTRVKFVTLPVATGNDGQVTDFRFWEWAPGTIELTQELPLISERTISIDGSRTSEVGQAQLPLTAAGNPQPTLLGQVFVDGQRIRRTRSGEFLAPGVGVQGFEISGENADGSALANLFIGGFQRGSGILIEGADGVLVDGVRLGENPGGSRIPNNRGITVGGSTGENKDSVTEGTTILDSIVVGGITSGIALEDGAKRTTIVGGSIGAGAISNEVGIFVAEGASDTRIGVNPITPQPAALTVTLRLSAGSEVVSVPVSLFDTPLLGLGVLGNGIEEGTTVAGLDSVARRLFLSKPAAQNGVVSARIGHVATRATSVDGGERLTVPESVEIKDLYLGQLVIGEGLEDGTVITNIDPDKQELTLSRPFLSDGSGTVTFGRPSRTIVENNRRGIVLRSAGTRITNTDVRNNTENGIEVLAAGQQIGTAPAVASVRGTAGTSPLVLTTYETAVRTTAGSDQVALPAAFANQPEDPAGLAQRLQGVEVFGPGIPAGTTVKTLEPPSAGVRSWRLTLSQPADQSRVTTISFGVRDQEGRPLTLVMETGRESLAVGQTVHGEGVPQFTNVVSLRLRADGPDLITLSSPLAVLEPGSFAFTPGSEWEWLFVNREDASNRIFGNGSHGVWIEHDVSAEDAAGNQTELVANYFALLGEGTEAAGNRRGPIKFASLGVGQLPPRFQARQYDRIDWRGNKYGLSTLPEVPPPLPPGLGPQDPGDPTV